MATRNYERIATIEEFGRQLLLTGDLDPLYIALRKAALPDDQMKRWLLAYWCCYNAGASSWLSELGRREYWTYMQHMAANDIPTPLADESRWPRGHERRHFRGLKAVQAVQWMMGQNDTPEQLVDWLIKAAPRFEHVRQRVLTMPQFGPWIAFKVGDMIDRVLGVRIDFTDADVMMFEQPYNSALEVWQSSLREGSVGETSNDAAVSLTAKVLLGHFRQYTAPPTHNRPVNIQEVETILCKWKSHNTGSYPMGVDSQDLRDGLGVWAVVSPTAQQLLVGAP